MIQYFDFAITINVIRHIMLIRSVLLHSTSITLFRKYNFQTDLFAQTFIKICNIKFSYVMICNLISISQIYVLQILLQKEFVKITNKTSFI